MAHKPKTVTPDVEPSIESLIEAAGKGLRFPQVAMCRSFIDLPILEKAGVTDFTPEEQRKGYIIGWGVSISEMVAGMGNSYYHRTLRGALELACKASS